MDEHKINRAALCTMAMYGAQVMSPHRAGDHETLCDFRLAKWEPRDGVSKRYTITDAGRAYLERTRPKERAELERRLNEAKRDGDGRAQDRANNELLEWDRAAHLSAAREARKAVPT